ncbi:MutS-related protein [Leptospira ilyithenensis]|uniref:MutS-related protein n=1 Tax=Leptospira ilyithenensis TaxID=2484901 RepID=UPI001FE64EAA|nr:DNA mismatch repair protein [Leptospira ilyithenensis]
MFVFFSIIVGFFGLYLNKSEFLHYAFLGIPILCFAILVSIYQKRKHHLAGLEKTLALIERELNRKKGVLKKIPSLEVWEFPEAVRNHPLSVDLDLCTKQGLFAYLDTTVTKDSWDLFLNRLLQNTNEDPKILQTKVKELLKNRSLNYQLLRKAFPYGEDTKEKIPFFNIAKDFHFWEKQNYLRFLYPILGVFTPFWLLLSSFFSLPFAPLLLFVNLILFIRFRKNSLKVWKQIQNLNQSLENFESVWKRLHPKRRVEIQKMSRALEKLGNSSEWIISPLPHFLLNAIFLWDLWKVNRFEKWKLNWAPLWTELKEDWIRVDSLLPFANLSFLNPNMAFPEWNDKGIIEAENLGHPLIGTNHRITNVLPTVGRGGLFIITGSNMSGKTTYLRAIAVSLLIAGSGGPIPGTRMSIAPFEIHTLIRSQDSLENGISFFYSEVRRLSGIIRETKPDTKLSVLFLDEILKGTNSKERQIATREILFALKEKGAIVFLTTHDLQIAEIEGATPFHFTELELNGEMIFDYKLREGISHTTNALRILRKEGIPIREEI